MALLCPKSECYGPAVISRPRIIWGRARLSLRGREYNTGIYYMLGLKQ